MVGGYEGIIVDAKKLATIWMNSSSPENTRGTFISEQ